MHEDAEPSSCIFTVVYEKKLSSLPRLHSGSPLQKLPKMVYFLCRRTNFFSVLYTIFCRFLKARPCLGPSMFAICLKVSTLQTQSLPNIRFSMIKSKWSHLPLCSTITITFLVSMAAWDKELFSLMSLLRKNVLLV